MNASVRRHLALSLAAVLLAACTPGGGSIYSTIQNEVKVVDNTLDNNLVVMDVVGAAGGPYYVAAGKIWPTVPGASTVTWDKGHPLTLPTAASGAIVLCNGLLAWPPAPGATTLWGSFTTPDASLGLYRNDGSLVAPLTTWTHVTGSASELGTRQVMRLRNETVGATATLVVIMGSTSTPPLTYDVFSSTDGISFTLSSITGATSTVNDVIYAAGNWYATEGATLYTTGATLGGTLTAVPLTGVTVATGEELRDILYDGTTLYVSSKLGHVFYSSDGGANWLSTTAAPVSGITPGLLGFAGPVGGAGGKILVGADGYGYYELSGSPLALTRASDTLAPSITTFRLYSAAVRRFFVDGTTRLFACTSATGLWRGEISGSGAAATITWNWE